MKFSLILLATLALRAYAENFLASDRIPRSLSTPTHHAQSSDPFLRILSKSQHEERDDDPDDDRPTCGPVFSDSVFTRELYRLHERNFTLERRIMTVPNGDMDKFMETEVGKGLPIVWNKKVRKQNQDMATSVFKEFYVKVEKGSDAGKLPTFSFGADGLCGCTMLLIVSRRAVYSAHYWESISFSPEHEWLEDGDTPETLFQTTVLDGLTKGVGKNKRKEQVPLTDAIGKIEDPFLHAYLITPKPTAKRPGYADKWVRIKNTVGDILPGLKDDSLWTNLEYKALSFGSKLLDTSRGKLLFKFDPDSEPAAVGPAVRIANRRRAALWFEGDAVPKHNDVWDGDAPTPIIVAPLPAQGPALSWPSPIVVV